MKQGKIISNVESKYDVGSLRKSGLALWLDLRNRFYFKMSTGSESNLVIDSGTYKQVLFSVFYGFFNWFRRYDTWVFSSRTNRLPINGKYYDRFFDYPASKLRRTLFIELSVNGHYARKKVASSYITSRAPLILMEKLTALFIRGNFHNKDLYKQMCVEYNVNIDPTYSVKKMVSQYKVMRFLLRFKRPTYVFVAPAYTTYGYIKALKEKGVRVIEIQHGAITTDHYGYNLHADFDRSYFPDYLLTLGTNEKSIFEGGNTLLDPSVVIPVGSFYIDHILKTFQPDFQLSEMCSSYKTVLSVSLQDCEYGRKLVPFLLDFARCNPDCILLMKPRRTPETYYTRTHEIPENVVFMRNLNVYEVILHSHYHITVYSSCALEAPALGVSNILVNIDGKASAFFGDVLNDPRTTHYCDTAEELASYIISQPVPESEIVSQAHGNIIVSNYKRNIDEFLNQLI